MNDLEKKSMDNLLKTMEKVLDKIEIVLDDDVKKTTKYLTTDQLMAYLSCSKETVYRLKSNYTIPFYKLQGKLYVLRDNVDTAIKNGEI